MPGSNCHGEINGMCCKKESYCSENTKGFRNRKVNQTAFKTVSNLFLRINTCTAEGKMYYALKSTKTSGVRSDDISFYDKVI